MEFNVPGGYVTYEDNTITGFGGKIECLSIPDEIRIEKIAKKAFFGAKNLGEVRLPESIQNIGEWAFASCTTLRRFYCDSKPDFAQGVFLNDENLSDIYIKDGENFSALLSAVCTQMEAEYLLNPQEAGSREWYTKFDSRLFDILKEDDTVGYEKHVLCGEEDLLFDISVYVSQNRKRKANLVYLRLIYNDCLELDNRKKLEDYLKETYCGAENESGFLVLLDNAKDERYIRLYLDLGMLRDENFELTLSKLGQREATLKAELIKHHDAVSSGGFFEDMLL